MGAGSMVFPILVSFALKENQALWFAAMLAVGIITALTIFLQYKFSRERVTEELMAGNAGAEEEPSKGKAASMGTQFKAVASEKWWWVVMVFYMIFQFSGAIKNGSMSYFCRWVLDNSALGPDGWGTYQSILAIMGAIPMAVAMLFVNPLCQKFGKRKTVSAFLVLGVIGGVIAIMGGSNIVPVAVGVALKCLGSSPACYMILAMLADVIDHIEWKTGLRTDGLTMSIYSSLMVAASPVMNAVFSAILNMVGYDQNLVVGSRIAGAFHAGSSRTGTPQPEYKGTGRFRRFRRSRGSVSAPLCSSMPKAPAIGMASSPRSWMAGSMIEPFKRCFGLLENIARVRMYEDFTLDEDTIVARCDGADASI